MTTEEKAKAYDEAIGKAAALYKASEPMSGCNIIIETLFPELKESEDERIRKELLEHCKNQAEPYIQTGNEYPQIQSWITWLKKQGNKDKLIKELGEYKVKYCNMKYSQCKFESNDVVKCLINGMKFYYEDNEEATWGTEKFSMKVKDILTWLENQSEHKAEPKFHEGDWCIDNEDGVIFQIVKVLDNTYTYKTNEGKEYSGTTHYSLENDAHLWTIQDANDGDVLVFKNNICGIIICKSPTDYDTRSYCRFVSDNFINKEESGWDSTLLVPTTKEQRDLLFQKMKEAGYEWDYEKKELKKIKQKPAEWHREDEQNLNACLGFIPDEFLRRWLKDVVHVKYDKPVWSEEGEGYFDTLIGIMNERMNCSDEGSMVYNVYKKAQDWLKSLKGRVQPKQEWSEEDEEMLNSTILFVEHSAVTTICKEKSNIISWLKSLKERIGE